jgi:hypothetical protein
LSKAGVAVKKLYLAKFAKMKLRQEAFMNDPLGSGVFSIPENLPVWDKM